MATVNKNFKVKNGLNVAGTATFDSTVILGETPLRFDTVTNKLQIQLNGTWQPIAFTSEIPDATNIMGSSHIRNLCDNIICVWRNRAKEKLVEEGKTSDEELKIIPDAKVFVQKQRNSQWEGSFNFWYDQKGLKYKESPNAR